ncbi:MAG TPA: phosphoribosyltransferase family protein [Pyrinomonadaceae bacterium]|nr:phosphoribosyltransferase family protein [Pyrinomonadaceae bacterium]
MDEKIVEVHSATEIAERTGALASEINAHFEGRELTMLGVLEDSFVFLADLLRAMRAPALRTAFLRFDHRSFGGVQDLSFNTPIDISGRDVVLVEGVLDTGVTQEYLMKQLEARGASSVRLCVLLDKPDRRRTGVEANWRAFVTHEDYVVGYGLGFQERWRELPYLATISRPNGEGETASQGFEKL